jgi:hypothetical protein
VRWLAAALCLVACKKTFNPADEPVAPRARVSEDTAQHAVEHAADFMAAFPVAQLQFDSAIGLSAIRARTSGLRLDDALTHARHYADLDADNPLRRAFDPGFVVAAEKTAQWEVPAPGAPRVNVNRVVIEALHCAQNGLRPATLDYLSGPMRDGGGYQTTHALWALTIARDAGCVKLDEFNRRAGPLVAELRAANGSKPGPAALDVDLFAERTLMIELAGARDDQVTRWVQALIAAQNKDGSFGAEIDGGGEPPYWRFHATMTAAWAIAER